MTTELLAGSMPRERTEFVLAVEPARRTNLSLCQVRVVELGTLRAEIRAQKRLNLSQ
jgi:hypothetical protein